MRLSLNDDKTITLLNYMGIAAATKASVTALYPLHLSIGRCARYGYQTTLNFIDGKG